MNHIVVNKSPIDQFTFVHIGAGVAARMVGLSLTATLVLGFLWDFALEPALKKAHPETFPFPSQDAPSHALIDALVPGIGWVATDWLMRR